MKKTTQKKMLGLIMALAMTVTVFTGCGNQETSIQGTSGSQDKVTETEQKETAETKEVIELEPVTLKVFIPGAEGEGSADVVKVFNEKLAEVLPNTTIELERAGAANADYTSKWTMFMAGKEKIDLAWAGYYTPFRQDVLDGTLLGISKYINESTPNLLAEKEKFTDYWYSCMYEGEYYGVPSVQPSSFESQAFYYSQKIEAYMDLDAYIAELRNNTKCTEKLLDMMEATIQAAIDDGAIKVGDLSWYLPVSLFDLGVKGYAICGNDTYYDYEADEVNIVYCWEIPEVQMCFERAAKWYDMGWITSTQAIGQMPEGAERLFDFGNSYNMSWANADEKGVAYEVTSYYNKDITWNYILTNEPTNGPLTSVNFGGFSSYMAIPYTSENPERAIMLLDVLHDEVGTVGNDLYNLLCYGFEQDSPEAEKYGWFGYKAVEEDGQLKADRSVLNGETSKHAIQNWLIGNTYKVMHDGGYLTTVASKEYADYYWSEIHPNKIKVASTGVTFNYDNWTDVISAIDTIKVEYNDQFRSGCGGTDKLSETLKVALDKIYNADFESFKNDLEAQIAAHNAK